MPARSNCSKTDVGTLTERAGQFATAALYGSLTLIGAIVFGTLSIHPF